VCGRRAQPDGTDPPNTLCQVKIEKPCLTGAVNFIWHKSPLAYIIRPMLTWIVLLVQQRSAALCQGKAHLFGRVEAGKASRTHFGSFPRQISSNTQFSQARSGGFHALSDLWFAFAGQLHVFQGHQLPRRLNRARLHLWRWRRPTAALFAWAAPRAACVT
jgi:hypothetical protein